MKRYATLIILLAGCAAQATPHGDPRATGCACVGLAFAVVAAESPAPPTPAPRKCCGTCGKNGLPRGKVLSGDKLSIVPCGPTTCGCPDDCECKKTATCTTGTCR